MRLAVNLGYWGAGNDHENLALAQEADRLGYDSVWAAEAYGSDAATVLSWVAAQTTSIDIGSAVFQIPARSPAMTAMTAATLDTLSGGRFRLGLGVSGPQVSEGWHGVRFADPLGRTEEYVRIVRQALSRRRVVAAGDHFTLPLPDGQGKALALAIHPVRPSIPIYLAAVGPKNLDLTGRIADGWLAIFFDPASGAGHIERIRRAATAAGRNPDAIDVSVQLDASLGDSIEAAAVRVRPHAALYIGGMGSRETNFYHRIATNMGFGSEADEVQDRYLARDYAGAADAVPLEFISRTSLLGDEASIAESVTAFAAAGVTSLNIGVAADDPPSAVRTLEVVANAVRRAGGRG